MTSFPIQKKKYGIYIDKCLKYMIYELKMVLARPLWIRIKPNHMFCHCHIAN